MKQWYVFLLPLMPCQFGGKDLFFKKTFEKWKKLEKIYKKWGQGGQGGQELLFFFKCDGGVVVIVIIIVVIFFFSWGKWGARKKEVGGKFKLIKLLGKRSFPYGTINLKWLI